MKNMIRTTDLHEVECITTEHMGVVRHDVVTRRRTPRSAGIYVAHPITGIRMSRILDMQRTVTAVLTEAGARRDLSVSTLFPMRSTHLRTDEIGDNVYPDGSGDFARVRHYTLQNRMDALVHSDGVLVNYDLADDDGVWRRSNGIPFDIGWARGIGKPTAVVLPAGNPNVVSLDGTIQFATGDLASAAGRLLDRIAHGKPKMFEDRVVAEILEFPETRSAEVLVALAEMDVRRHVDGCRAIIAVMPGERSNPNFHGQVDDVVDWIVPTLGRAASIVERLLGSTEGAR